jgi:hypothetical protein
MPRTSGRRLALSPARRFICDLMHYARQVPAVSVRRQLQVGPLVEARKRLNPRPGWCAIFTKAYAIVSRARPELRRAYMRFPWPHLYEHPLNIAAISIERTIGSDLGVLVGKVRGPENQPLLQIEAYLREFKEKPLEQFNHFRRFVWLYRLPWPIRRLIWTWGYHSSGARRARHMGTFAVTSVSGLGADLVNFLSPLSTSLTYGPVDAHGQVEVAILFDHRVADGATLARVLQELEQALTTEILAELQQLAALQRRGSKVSTSDGQAA